MSIANLWAHIDNQDGYCRACKAWTNLGGCEPDARRYECERCGLHTVYGAEEAVMMGLVDDFDDEDDDTDEA